MGTRLQAKHWPRSFRRTALHLFRFGLFLLIIWLVHSQHQAYRQSQRHQDRARLTLNQVKPLFPDAAELSQAGGDHEGRTVLDAQENPLGYVVQTSPRSDSIVGYSGPNNVLVAFNTDDRIVGIRLLSSGDTKEHAHKVRQDDRFMSAFDGLSWDDAAQLTEVDGVSGATLTSLAIAEGTVYRLSGSKPSYRFPEPLQVEEVKPFFPQAERLVALENQPGTMKVIDAEGNRLGNVMRTSPAADQVVGYQGPTDTLIAFDAKNHIKGIDIRRSYDNQPYVGYVTEDRYFLNRFNEMTPADLIALDLEETGIEGVSGATMTSQAVARGIVKAAQQRQAAAAKGQSKKAFALNPRDIGTLTVLGGAFIIALTPLRGNKRVRIAWQAVLIGYLGFLSGDLLSQALLVGWAQSGIPWRFAPGMVVLTVAALVVPLTTKHQLYCHYLCPHGAAQEWLKHRLPWQVNLSHRVVRLLKLIPVLILVWILVIALLHLPFNLVALEPFDAYLITVAGWGTLTVAVVGLIASLFVPMAYCRFGCPTGLLLSYLRFNARSDHIGPRDGVALGLAGLAALLVWSGSIWDIITS
jgi:transcriptional regulator of nitric oxide reductase